MTEHTVGSGGEREAQASPVGKTDQDGRPGQMSQMLSTISHEIKNPLASLKLNAQMVSRAIERGRTPRIESAALLTQAVDQIDLIASELSDAARVDSGRMSITLKCTDLAALLQRAANETASAAQRPIATEISGSSLLAQVDESRIRQAIAYLLANALTYTPTQSSIALTARRVDKRIRVEARDQGPGIAAHDLPYIFEPFYRGTTTPQPGSHEGAGLGLGLYIARRIVERHAGAVGAESTPGHGATIWFTLPCAPCS